MQTIADVERVVSNVRFTADAGTIHEVRSQDVAGWDGIADLS
jgi:hypothetical protein